MKAIVPKQHRMAGQIAVLATAFLWSTSGLLIKLLTWHPIVIAGARSIIAACFLLVLRLLFPPPAKVKNPAFPFWAATFGNVFTMLTFVIANKLTASANVILLQYGAPVWAALLGWWLIKEKPRWEHWCALLLVIGGLFIFFREGLGSGSFGGDALSVFSGVLFAAHTVFLRMLKDGNPRDAILMSHVITGIVSVPFMILYPPSLSVPSLLPILYMGFIQIGLASVLFSYGIKRVSAVQAMLTATLEPICNPIWVFIIIGEKPSVSALIGGGIILCAVVFSSVIGRRRETAGNSLRQA